MRARTQHLLRCISDQGSPQSQRQLRKGLARMSRRHLSWLDDRRPAICRTEGVDLFLHPPPIATPTPGVGPALGEDICIGGDLTCRCHWPVPGYACGWPVGWVPVAPGRGSVDGRRVASLFGRRGHCRATGRPDVPSARRPVVKSAAGAVGTRALGLPPVPTATPGDPKDGLMIPGDASGAVTSVPVVTSAAVLGVGTSPFRCQSGAKHANP